MPWECAIRLLNEDDEPLIDYKVTIFFSGLIGSYLTERTDGDGWANFENPYLDNKEPIIDYVYVQIQTFPTIKTKILVEGGTISSGETMSFTISDDDWS